LEKNQESEAATAKAKELKESLQDARDQAKALQDRKIAMQRKEAKIDEKAKAHEQKIQRQKERAQDLLAEDKKKVSHKGH